MSEQKSKILVVDDDLRLRDLLQRYLTEQGFAVATVSDTAGMDRSLGRERFDLIVLDLMMPGEDGLAACRRLRGTRNTIPIIMLTAKGDDVERIVGLEMGADDYLPKPFNPRELVARINAVLRRRGATAPPGSPATEAGEVSFGGMTVNLANRTLVRDGKDARQSAVTEAEAIIAQARDVAVAMRFNEIAASLALPAPTATTPAESSPAPAGDSTGRR